MSDCTKVDNAFMKKALTLAEKGRGLVSPNPMVGAVIVKDGKVIGEGYHQKYGDAHAEINALNQAGDKAMGATLYVTLEPCCHTGKTPPCTEAIFNSGISKVVVGAKDPNPLVNGQGITFLKSKGIQVVEDILSDKCYALNESFDKYIKTGNPLVTLKVAQTIDGRIATSTGHSKWITSEQARKDAHKLRAQHDAILTGIGTIISDDPKLTVRLAKGVSPKRIILDSKLRIPLDANIFSNENPSKTIIFTTDAASKEKVSRVEDKGAQVNIVESDERGWVPQSILWSSLGKMGISSVLVEGGSTVHTECLRHKFADKLVVYIAPKILGTGIDSIGDLGITNINDTINFKNVSIKQFDGNFVIYADIDRGDE